jgi:membrane associated rhomboid family serine protease
MAKCAQCGRQLPAFSFRKICEWCVRHEAAQRGEEDEDAIQPVMPVPWAQGMTSSGIVTQALFAINLMVFAAMALEGIAMTPSSRQLIQWGANFGPYTLGGQEWRLLSCTFLHIGLMHIFFNMWCLWDLGAMCEGLFGHATFAAVYLISGVGASLASVWWRPVGVSAGASGAIFGIVGALIAAHYAGCSQSRSCAQGCRHPVRGRDCFWGRSVVASFAKLPDPCAARRTVSRGKQTGPGRSRTTNGDPSASGLLARALRSCPRLFQQAPVRSRGSRTESYSPT